MSQVRQSLLSERRSLRYLVLKGSIWTLAGHGSSQAVRLAKSLVLTRLLFPEAFGLMSLVVLVMFGLEMMSDLGLGPAIIRDKRGDDPDFLRTAWTIQAARGFVLSAFACAIALPMAWFYREPDLAALVAVTGLTALTAGFDSMSVHTCRRKMELGRLAVLEVVTEILGTVVVIAWAWMAPTVWSLVAGALVTRLFYTVMSHIFLPGIQHRFRWDPTAVRTLIGFGKWIFLSSALEFVSRQGDRLLLGRVLDMTSLGVYSIAVLLSEAVASVIIKVNFGVFYPAYGRTVQNGPGRLRDVYYRARLAIDVLFILPIAALMASSNLVVAILYDARYAAAGWMLQIMCVRLLMASALRSSEACLVALGFPSYGMMQSAARAGWTLLAIPIGWALGGIEGVVWGVALCELPVLVVLWIGLHRHGLLLIRRELYSVGFSAVGGFSGLALARMALT